LTLTVFLISLALWPNLILDNVSESLNTEGDTAIINAVLLLPPKDSCNNLVNLLSLYGICLLFLLSVNALITWPNADNDLLICLASSNTWPSAWVLPTHSEPAKSTKNSLPVWVEPSISSL